MENLWGKGQIAELSKVIEAPDKSQEGLGRRLIRRKSFESGMTEHEKWYKDSKNFLDLPPETQRYAQEATESRVQQLKKIREDAEKDVLDGYNKEKAKGLTAEEKKTLEKEVEATRKEIKDQFEKDVNTLKLEIKHSTSKYLPWLQHELAMTMTEQEIKDSMQSALKKFEGVAEKMVEASKTYDKEVGSLKTAAAEMQKAFKNLSNARANRPSASHEEITFNYYDKALSQAQSDQAVLDGAKKAGLDARKSQSLRYPKDKNRDARIEDAARAINAETDGDRRAALVEETVKKLLNETVVKDHTTFRLTKPEGSKTHLDANGYQQMRLGEILSQEQVTQAIKKMQADTGGSHRSNTIKENLEIAVKEAYNYSLDKNAQEAVIHKDAAERFLDQISASADTRQNALNAAQPGKETDLVRIKNINKEVHTALNHIQHFSPEAKAAREQFRDKYIEAAGAASTTTTREAALNKMNAFNTKEAEVLGELPEEIQAHLKVNSDTDMTHLNSIAKASIEKLITLGARDEHDDENINAAAYDKLKKQINERYDPEIEKAQAAVKEVQLRAQGELDKKLAGIKKQQDTAAPGKELSETQIAEQRGKAYDEYNARTLPSKRTYEKLQNKRDAALAEVNQLYAKESVSQYVDEVKAQRQKLHAQFTKRDNALKSYADVIDTGYRAEAIKARYERSQFGEALRLDDEILHAMKESEKPLLAEKEAVANVATKLDLLHRAENYESLAKDEWAIKSLDAREAAREREDSPDQNVNEAIKRKKSATKEAAEEALRYYKTTQDNKERARQEYEKAVAFKDEKTAEKHVAEEHLHHLVKEREIAGKRDDANDAKYFRFLDRIRDDMKATMAFERQRILMKEHYKQQIKAAIIAGISQGLADAFKSVAHAQYIGMNNRLMQQG